MLQVSSCQPLLHEQVQALLVKLFECSHEDVDVLVQVHFYSVYTVWLAKGGERADGEGLRGEIGE